jgi:adenylate cyclase
MDWEAEGLLDGVQGERERQARLGLLDALHADGVPVEELRRAVAEDRLVLLPVEQVLTSQARYTAREIAEESGLGLDFLMAGRRALGLPVPAPDERVLDERDLEVARVARLYREAGFPDDEALEVTRVLGHGMARYAEAVRSLVAQTFIEAGADEATLGQRYADVARELLPLAAPAMELVFALHLRQVLRNDAISREQLASGRVGEAHDTTIAFADLVGFTALGETVPVEELGGVAGRLWRLAGEVVGPPVRIVKQIGDAVMLVSPDPSEMVECLLCLLEVAAEHDGVPALRVGAAFGPAVNRWGDWFGSTVNVASRLTARARPDSVLVTDALREAVGNGRYRFSAAGEKKLKGLSSPVTTYRARRSEAG